jgi:hypothetical protein
LRGISPRDKGEYKLQDLALDLFEMIPGVKKECNNGLKEESLEYNSDLSDDSLSLEQRHALVNFCMVHGIDGPITEESFREHMYEEYIVDRSIALDSMKEGLHLNGACIM